ncbi:hypothetical protein BpHYR1_053040 [Brachionus plicatilis]|uniref:Uncharacterized protein n=1 Tax=Brachionus plicatilis TaxID=10195 RepID=A0A3M7T012_BRAPC|nr:hypothetical protein BpHYR1_053040 [Brachionus plicatilis]
MNLSPVPKYLSLYSKSRFENKRKEYSKIDPTKDLYKFPSPFVVAFFNLVYHKDYQLSFLYLEKTTEYDFSIDIFIFHLISHCSSSLAKLHAIPYERLCKYQKTGTNSFFILLNDSTINKIMLCVRQPHRQWCKMTKAYTLPTKQHTQIVFMKFKNY